MPPWLVWFCFLISVSNVYLVQICINSRLRSIWTNKFWGFANITGATYFLAAGRYFAGSSPSRTTFSDAFLPASDGRPRRALNMSTAYLLILPSPTPVLAFPDCCVSCDVGFLICWGWYGCGFAGSELDEYRLKGWLRSWRYIAIN